MGIRTYRRATGTVLLLALSLLGSASAVARTPKAVFIIVDGVPADTLERVATPHIDALAAEGGYARAQVGGPVGTPAETPTVSAPGYMSLITGTWADKHNVRDNYDLAPNYDYWNIFRLALTVNPALSTGIFSTWRDNRTVLIGEGLPEAGDIRIQYVVDGFEDDTERFPHQPMDAHIALIDEYVASQAAATIELAGPDLSWVYLQYTDDIGHEFGDSPEMDAAIMAMDGLIGKVWSSIQQRRSEHPEEDWLILVTTDHGRDLEGREHEFQSERERMTWIATNSQLLTPTFYEQPEIVDIYPSIANHLGLTIPESVRAGLDGKSFIKEQPHGDE
jgi:predicted AlkP superfamily pyrophosphatase or phosphodiesterase